MSRRFITMSRIPHIGLTRSASKIQDENAFRKPQSSGQSIKRPADSQMVAMEKKQKVEIARVSSSTTKQVKKGALATKSVLKNPGFSEKAKQRALRPIAESQMMRGSMPAISLTAQKPTSTTKQKRPAWDLKGRIQDMEEHFQKTQTQNATLTEQLALNNQRIAALEADNSLLNRDVQIKVTETEEASTQIFELQTKLKHKSEECEKHMKEKESLQSQMKRLNNDYVNLQNQYDQETSALKSNITSLTCSKSVLQTQLDAVENLVNNHKEENTQLNRLLSEKDKRIEGLLTQVSTMESRLLKEESTRRKLHNTIQELKGNIRVYCRMRPPLSEELKKGITLANITTQDGKVIEVHQLAENTRIEKKSEFSFDCVFAPTAPQVEVFDEISQLVQSSIDGYNVCIFAYGQTGSGKTYTMEGPENIVDFLSSANEAHLGMIPRSVEQIFKCIFDLEPKGWTYRVEALFLEIYNERIQDLLSSDPQNGKCEIIKSGGKGNDCLLSNVTASPVTCSEEVYNLLRKARINRVVAATKCNAHSSRSHYVFQLKIYGDNSMTGEKCEGILNLVDLAGSERVKDSGSAGDRLTEAKAINKSLSNLGKVIMSLSNKDNHVPYRDSKLTHLLANSLGGNSKTLMFVNISPDSENISETINSLRFATKVNQCNIGTAQKRVK